MVPVQTDPDAPQPLKSAVGHVPLPLPRSRRPRHRSRLRGLQARGPKWRRFDGISSLPIG